MILPVNLLTQFFVFCSEVIYFPNLIAFNLMKTNVRDVRNLSSVVFEIQTKEVTKIEL